MGFWGFGGDCMVSEACNRNCGVDCIDWRRPLGILLNGPGRRNEVMRPTPPGSYHVVARPGHHGSSE